MQASWGGHWCCDGTVCVDADGFGVADVHVAIGLRREARDNFIKLPISHIRCHDVANKIARRLVSGFTAHSSQAPISGKTDEASIFSSSL